MSSPSRGESADPPEIVRLQCVLLVRKPDAHAYGLPQRGEPVIVEREGCGAARTPPERTT